MRLILLSLFFSFTYVSSFSQTDSLRNSTIGINLSRGFIISHSPSMAALANRHISGYELYWEHNTFGLKDWHNRYNYLKIGVLLKYFNLNNKDVLGNSIAISPYFKIHLYSGKNLNIRFRPSIGVAYLTKRFQSENNFENIAIGSRVNMFISASIESEIKLFRNTNALIAIGLDHQSNTGFKSPNLGINMPFISAGFNLGAGKTNAKTKRIIPPFEKEKPYWRVSGGIGLNETNPPNGKKYVAKALFLSREKKINYKSTIGYGLDFYHNSANQAILKTDSRTINDLENIQVGLSVLHILHFGKLSFTSQLSYYLKSENKDLGKVYHVFGGRYRSKSNFDVFFLGKTHIDKAEFVMVGIGYRFHHE